MTFDSIVEITEEKSRFIGLVKNNFNKINDVKNIINELKKEYKKAKHICWAYNSTIEGINYKKYNDGGEPNGTAGMPILSAIESKELDNILVVVVRYFGGKKLGASKLLRTYRKITKESIDNLNREKHG